MELVTPYATRSENPLGLGCNGHFRAPGQQRLSKLRFLAAQHMLDKLVDADLFEGPGHVMPA